MKNYNKPVMIKKYMVLETHDCNFIAEIEAESEQLLEVKVRAVIEQMPILELASIRILDEAAMKSRNMRL